MIGRKGEVEDNRREKNSNKEEKMDMNLERYVSYICENWKEEEGKKKKKR